MKRLLFAFAILAACKSPAPPPAPKAVPAAALSDVAGESTDTAVMVPADAPNGGVDFENEWIYSRFGRFRRRGGGTGTLNGRRYDVVDVELPNGDTKKIYFDITENWSRWKPPGAASREDVRSGSAGTREERAPAPAESD